MSKHIMLLGTLLCLSLSANAQWYLFPGKENRGKPREPFRKEVPAEAETVKTPEAVEPAEAVEPEAETDIIDMHAPAADEYFYDAVETVNVALILPLGASSRPSGNFFEMYCGAMLAARDLGNSGMSVSINVYDSTDSDILNPDIYSGNDVILGPVNAGLISRASRLLPDGKYLISPLEPKAEPLADSSRIIQAPPSSYAQHDELAKWLAADRHGAQGRLYVIRDGADSGSDYLISRLREEGVAFDILPSIGRDKVAEGRNDYLVVSDNDSFMATNIRELGLASGKCEPVLYTTSRARNLPIDSKLLYKLNARMTANYHIDYSDPSVKEFVMTYRSLFSAEPGSFAFQGYDAVKYFAGLCDELGRRWAMKVADAPSKGLQSDFRFSGEGISGFRNHAVRRIMYSGATMSTSLQ